MKHLYFLIPIAALAAVALAGCSAYTQSATVTPVNDVRTDARACLLGTATPVGLISPLAGVAVAPLEASSMDGCMAQKGWVRK